VLEPSEDEAETIRRILAGDQTAWGRIYEAYRKLVYTIAYPPLGSMEDAQDVIQETFLRFHRSLVRYNPEFGGLKGYITAIARNVVRDFLANRLRQLGAPVDEAILDAAITQQPPLEVNPLKDAVLKHLAFCSDELGRKIFRLRMKPMRNKEIAETLGVGQSTVGSYVARIKQCIRQRIRKEQQNEGEAGMGR